MFMITLFCFLSPFAKFINQETHHHLKLSPAGRAFLYLPLEHRENRETQVGHTHSALTLLFSCRATFSGMFPILQTISEYALSYC